MPFRNPYDGSGIPIVNDAKLNVFPLVTDCDADKEPVANRREFVVSTIA